MGLLCRSQPDYGDLRKQLLRLLLSKAHGLIVPAAALKVDATDEGAILDLFDIKTAIGRSVHAENLRLMIRRVLLIDEGELELECIDLDLVLSGIVLQDGREEALSEEEAREPEDLWRLLLIDPLAECLDAQREVPHIASQGLHRRV